MLVLLPIKANTVLEKVYYKKNTVRFFCFNYGKIIFTLLRKVVIGHMVITFLNIKNECVKGMFKKPVIAVNMAFITAQIISCTSSFV